jgi:RNA recognition motif 2
MTSFICEWISRTSNEGLTKGNDWCNLGYAFINFTSALDAASFTVSQAGKRWKIFKSDKLCSVCFATIVLYTNSSKAKMR